MLTANLSLFAVQSPVSVPWRSMLLSCISKPCHSHPLGSTRHRTALGEVSSNLENLQTTSVQSFEANPSAQSYVPSRKSPLRRTMLAHHWEEVLHDFPSPGKKRQKELFFGKNGAGGKDEPGVSRADLSQFSKQGDLPSYKSSLHMGRRPERNQLVEPKPVGLNPLPSPPKPQIALGSRSRPLRPKSQKSARFIQACSQKVRRAESLS